MLPQLVCSCLVHTTETLPTPVRPDPTMPHVRGRLTQGGAVLLVVQTLTMVGFTIIGAGTTEPQDIFIIILCRVSLLFAVAAGRWLLIAGAAATAAGAAAAAAAAAADS